MRLTRGAAAATLVAALVLVVPGAPAHAEAVDCLGVDPESPEPASTTDRSLPLDALGVEDAHAWLAQQRERPGEGVRVAVVDSGVGPRVGGAIRVVDRVSFAQGGAQVVDGHGTAVAGLIAGAPRERAGEDLLVGVAPAAEVVDVKVYDSVSPDEGRDPVRAANVAAGLDWVAENARRLRIGVVNVSLALGPGEEALERAVRRLVQETDVVVVAAAGNRPTEETDPLFEAFGPEVDDSGETAARPPGEDAAGQVHPAALPGVVAVTSTAHGSGAPDAADLVLQNSDTDVAVPTFGAISYGVDGGTCGVPSMATSWAAAEVSGVLAMLRGHHRGDTAEQAVARLVVTASGTPGVRTVLEGAGVVQPYEALVRPVRPTRAGELRRAATGDRDVERAAAPPAEVDLLAGARDQAVWWGLVGGGALVLALVLRPVLARRRS